MRHRKTIWSAVSVAAVLVLLASPPVSAAGHHQTVEHDPYFSQVYSGFLQCAKSSHRTYEQYSGFDMLAFGDTFTRQGSGCNTPFNLPAGWIHSVSTLQILIGSTWYTVKTDDRTNTSTASFALSGTNYAGGTAPDGYFYRHVSGHEAAIAGGWQPDLIAGTPLWHS